MIHPDLKLQWISDSVGYGLFAIKDIPKGTITFVQDELDVVIPKSEFENYSAPMQEVIDRYSYEDRNQNLIISWDMGKYMNHCCHANTLSTVYGFEIAVKDIKVGEQATDDYRLFSNDHKTELSCGRSDCQKTLQYSNLSQWVPIWDEAIHTSLNLLNEVSQPLKPFVSPLVQKQWRQDFRKGVFPSSSLLLQAPVPTPTIGPCISTFLKSK